MTRILVVDDHAITREPLARLLRIEGFDTATARHGAEAIEMIRQRAPDLVLLDLMMPKMDGVTMLAELRQDIRCKDVPVIMMTSLVEGSALMRAKQLGVLEILPKACFSFDELLRRISLCLQPNATRIAI